MGAGGSIIPEDFAGLSDEKKAEWTTKFEALVAEGKVSYFYTNILFD